MQQEIFRTPPQGEKRILDMVAKLPYQAHAQPPERALVLLEVDFGDSLPPFRPRIYHYTGHLSEIHQLEVLPIAVFLTLVLDGQGIDVHERRIRDREQLLFRYDYVALPGLDGSKYLQGDNLLGVALSALMRWPKDKRVEAALEALDKIVTRETDNWRKFLLCECVQAYAPLDDKQRIELNDLLEQPQRQGVRMAIKTWSEEAMEKGVQQGFQQGENKERLRLLKLQIETRFQTTLSEAALKRMESWSVDQLNRLAVEFYSAETLQKLGLED